VPDGPILICYDGSDEAKHAIEEAGGVLAPGPAIVLTSWEVLSIAVGGYPLDEFATGISYTDLDKASTARAERLAADGVELAAKQGFQAQSVVQQGPPAEAIVDVARDRHAKVIVLGSRGYTGLRASMIGSVSNAVIHHSPCPVLVVRREESEQ
jgi:nucleotide-binding universal stress UspA family protein